MQAMDNYNQTPICPITQYKGGKFFIPHIKSLQNLSNCYSGKMWRSNRRMNKTEHLFTIVHGTKPKTFCSYHLNIIVTLQQGMKTINHFLVSCAMHSTGLLVLFNSYLKILCTLKQRINTIKNLFTEMHGATQTTLTESNVTKTLRQGMKTIK